MIAKTAMIVLFFTVAYAVTELLREGQWEIALISLAMIYPYIHEIRAIWKNENYYGGEE